MTLSYDPKLRVAMDEIDKVLKRFDIGGLIVLQSESHTEFKMHIEPSWSLIRYMKNGSHVHFKVHASKQPQLDQTGAMIYSFRDMCALMFNQCASIIKHLEQHAKVEHNPFGGGIRNDGRDPEP